MATPKLSIVIPIHDMENGAYFLWRSVNALTKQTFKDFEVVIVKEGRMAENTNAGIQRARGELIKILYLDDYLAHENALQEIVDNFKPEDMWLVTGCLHQSDTEIPHSSHYPVYTENISTGNNGIGSPSVLTIRNEGHLLFDERMSWLLDCDLYHRYYKTYGSPKVLADLNVVIGLGQHQMTHKLTNADKLSEFYYLKDKNV